MPVFKFIFILRKFTLNFRYSIKDSIDDLVPGHKDHVYVYETEKEVILDSAGNEIVVLDVIMMSPFYAEAGYYHQKEQLVEVYDYSLANGCSAQEAYNALGYEGEFYMPILNFEDVQREYYKKLERKVILNLRRNTKNCLVFMVGSTNLKS